MVQPFPWHVLPRASGSRVGARAALRAYHPRATLTAAADRLAHLARRPVHLELRGVEVAEGEVTDLGRYGPRVVLRSPHHGVVVEVEAELALALVGAIAGVRPSPRVARRREVGDGVHGALAGVVLWLARELGSSDLTVAPTVPPPDELRRIFGLSERLVIRVSCQLGPVDHSSATRGEIRLVAGLPERVPAPTHDPAALVHLDDLLLRLPAVVARGVARASELLPLAIGDRVLADPVGPAGTVLLVGARGPRACLAELRSEVDDRREVRIRAEPVDIAPLTALQDNDARMASSGAPPGHDPPGAMGRPTDPEPTEPTLIVSTGQPPAPLVEALLDLPVEVRIELGALELPARRWAAVGPGDVLVLDQRVGDPISLRVGGRTMAHGELVEVDGQIGIRITKLGERT